jgi:hypothetical protein
MSPAILWHPVAVSEVNERRPRVYLHVGAPKTGTTYLQDVLWHNRGALRRSGVLYPGLSKDAQFHAAMDLQQAYFQEHLDPAVPGAWERLVGQARAWRGDVVLSHELFSLVDERAAARALDHLSWADVHVVLTARDLARQLPAVWQEDVKNRQVLTFAEFARELAAPGPDAHYLATLFWRLQDLPRVLDTWAAQLPAGRVHLVTVPPSGTPSNELWRRFSRATGIAGHTCEIDLTAESNGSLGVAETNLLRRLNVVLADSLEWPEYDVLVKDYLALSVMGRRDSSTPLGLPPAEYEWVADRSRNMVEALRRRNCQVVGDLTDLLPADLPRTDRHPDDVADDELLDTAVHALAGLLHYARDHTPPRRPGWRRRAIQISQRHAALTRLRRRYLAAKAQRGGHRSRWHSAPQP